MRIGLISDTHGALFAAVYDRFDGVDLVVHAGDLGSLAIASDLAAVAPLLYVRGNCDRTFPPETPEVLVENLGESWTLMVVHDLCHPDRLRPIIESQVYRIRPDLVVFGHSHRPFAGLRGASLMVNPGSATQPRGGGPPTIALFESDHGRGRIQILSLAGECLEEVVCPWPGGDAAAKAGGPGP